MTTFSVVDVGQKVVQKTMIDILQQNLFLYKTAMKYPVIKGANSKTVIWRKFGKQTLATTALTEGVPPSGQDMTMTNVTATLAQYGDFTKITDIAEFLFDREFLTEASNVLAIQSAETIDTLVVNIISAGSNVLYGDGTVSTRATVTAAMVLTTTLIRRGTRFLERNNVKRFNPMPVIGNAYALGIHPDVAADIRNDSNFVNAVNYSSPTPTNTSRGDLFTGELGYWMGCRIITSTIFPIYTGAGASGANVYANLLWGSGAYGVTEFSQGLETYIHTGGSQDTSNPLEQFYTVGWKWTGAAAILDQTRILRLETGATYSASTP